MSPFLNRLAVALCRSCGAVVLEFQTDRPPMTSPTAVGCCPTCGRPQYLGRLVEHAHELNARRLRTDAA